MNITLASHTLIQTSLFIGTIVATVILATIFRRMYKRFILKSSELIKSNPTKYSFIGHVITALIYCVGVGLAISQVETLRAYASSLLAGAGILAVAVGFASQHSLANIISGMFIVIFKPYKINDRITITGQRTGIVEDITLRHTVIRDFENQRIVIPNSVISDQTVINSDMVDQRFLKFIEFGISYDSDVDVAKEIIRRHAMEHPLRIDGRTAEQIEEGAPEVQIRLIALAESSVVLRAYVWTASMGDAFAVMCDMYESVKKEFDKSGIEIPFPHRTLVYKEPKSLNPKEIDPATV